MWLVEIFHLAEKNYKGNMFKSPVNHKIFTSSA